MGTGKTECMNVKLISLLMNYNLHAPVYSLSSSTHYITFYIVYKDSELNTFSIWCSLRSLSPPISPSPALHLVFIISFLCLCTTTVLLYPYLMDLMIRKLYSNIISATNSLKIVGHNGKIQQNERKTYTLASWNWSCWNCNPGLCYF